MAFLKALVLATLAGVLARQDVRAQAPSPSTLEYQVKAAYIYNFISFAEWPAESLGAAGNPMRICIAGRDEFGGALERTINGESVLGHPLVVERLGGADAAQCRVVFVSKTAPGRSADWVRAAGAGPTLTMGESEHFLRDGGMVNFVIDQGHVRFDVNLRAVEQGGLKLSSRLLRLARSVI